jgi:hypothetical protein
MSHRTPHPSRRAVVRVLATIGASLAAAAALVVGACVSQPAHAAEPVTVGVHLTTWHSDEQLNGVNPGLYVRADGWVAGLYRNSINRLSIHVGHQFETSGGPVGLGLYVGAVSGYQRKVTGRSVWCSSTPMGTDEQPCRDGLYQNWQDQVTGSSKAWLAPMVSPSVRLDLGGGISARLAYLHKPGGSNAVHLSVEHSF